MTGDITGDITGDDHLLARYLAEQAGRGWSSCGPVAGS